MPEIAEAEMPARNDCLLPSLVLQKTCIYIYILTLKKRGWSLQAGGMRFPMQRCVDKKGLLVEPLDIANFYGLDKNKNYGPYIKNGRPENTKKPQLQLFRTGTDDPKLLTRDSCLWAYVEDISSLMHKNVDTAAKRKDLENRVRAGL